MTSYTDPSSGEPNVPGWEEDANSPFTATNVSSKQFTLSSDWDRVLLIPAINNLGFDQLQVNGDTAGGNANYEVVVNSDSKTASLDAWRLNQFTGSFDSITIVSNYYDGQIQVNTEPTTLYQGVTVYGANSNVSPPINTFTVSDTSGANRSVKLKAYGMNL